MGHDGIRVTGLRGRVVVTGWVSVAAAGLLLLGATPRVEAAPARAWLAAKAKKVPLRPGMTAIFKADGEVLSRPAEGSAELFGVSKGERMVVVQVKDDWVRIQDRDGIKGWVPSRLVERFSEDDRGDDEAAGDDGASAEEGAADADADADGASNEDEERKSTWKNKDRKKDKKEKDKAARRKKVEEAVEITDSDLQQPDFGEDAESESGGGRRSAGGDEDNDEGGSASDDDEGDGRRERKRRKTDDEPADDGAAVQLRSRLSASFGLISRSQDFNSEASGIVGKYALATSAPTAQVVAGIDRWKGRVGLGLVAGFTTTIGGDGVTVPGEMAGEDETLAWKSGALELKARALYAAKEQLDVGGHVGYRRTAITVDVSEVVRLPSERLSGYTIGAEAHARRIGLPELDVSLGAEALLSAELLQTEGLRHGDETSVTAYRLLLGGTYRLNDKAEAILSYTLAMESYAFTGDSARAAGAEDGTREDVEHLVSVGISYRLM
ncbi:MAG: hypothetical protein EXR73_01910 [Myxococcales bacterium]|nr:hypothetical protein [Myxococcales bacterium]